MDKSITPTPTKTIDSINYLLNPSNVLLLIVFFILYCLLFFLLKNIENKNKELNNAGKIIDFVVFLVLFILILFAYLFNTKEEKIKYLKKSKDKFIDFLNEPFSIVPVFISLIVFYSAVFLFSISQSLQNSIVILTSELLLWILFTLLLIIDFFKFVLYIDLLNFSVSVYVEATGNGSKKKEHFTDPTPTMTTLIEADKKIPIIQDVPDVVLPYSSDSSDRSLFVWGSAPSRTPPALSG